MTIPKRLKRMRGRPLKSPPPLEQKDIRIAPADKMVRNYPRFCPICGNGTYSTVCRCGRLTVINK